MNKLFSLLTVSVLSLGALFVSACNSLPEGAQAPKLKIESLALSTQDESPVFIIGYTLKHASPEALPVIAISADVFLRNEKVATYHKQFKNQTIAPNQLERFELVVPANLLGSAGLDSLANNTLLMLQGSCAVTVNITDDSDLNSLNPVSSYTGLVKVISEQSVKVDQPESIPQPSADPVAEAQQAQAQGSEQPTSPSTEQSPAHGTEPSPAQGTEPSTAQTNGQDQAANVNPADAANMQQAQANQVANNAAASTSQTSDAAASSQASTTAPEQSSQVAVEAKEENKVGVKVDTTTNSKTTTEVVQPQSGERVSPANTAAPMTQSAPAQDLELLE